MQVSPTGSPPLHLYLSGGGFRATFFHLGALFALAIQKRLETLETITSVSGGSIAAAMFLAEMRQSIDGNPEDHANAVARATDKIYWRTRFSPRQRALSSIRALTRAAAYDEFGFSAAMERQYAKWFGTAFSAADKNLRDSKIEWRIVACDLLSCCRILLVHNSRSLAKPYYIPVDTNDIAKAVSASTALPFGFEPVTWTNTSGIVNRLADGGVLDNQGVREVEDRECTRICIDASGRAASSDMVTGWGAPTRAIDIMMDQTRMDGLRRDIELYELRQGMGRIRSEWWTQVMDLRTDLDDFNELEVSLLFLAGYQSVVGDSIPESHPLLEKFHPFWQFAHDSEQTNADVALEKLNEKRRRILSRGRSRWMAGLKHRDAMSILESIMSLYMAGTGGLVVLMYLSLALGLTGRLLPRWLLEFHYSTIILVFGLTISALASIYHRTGSRKLPTHGGVLRAAGRVVLASPAILLILVLSPVTRVSALFSTRSTGVHELSRAIDKHYGINRSVSWGHHWRKLKATFGIDVS